MVVTSRAVASGVKGGDDYRGLRLSGGLKKTIRTVDGPLLAVITKA